MSHKKILIEKVVIDNFHITGGVHLNFMGTIWNYYNVSEKI